MLPDPWHAPVNGFFQRYMTKTTVLSERVFEARARTALRHVGSGLDRRDRPVLELGTGWFPIVPVALHLCGFDAITSIDLVSHCSQHRLRDVVIRYAAAHRDGSLGDLLPGYVPDRVERLAWLVERQDNVQPADVGLTLLTGDVRDLTIEEGTFGLLVSNHVLEHIPLTDLPPILSKLRRLGSRDGLMSHRVDLGDHFSHSDPRITPYNFLRFSARQWRLIDNRIQPQNRLRVDDYRSLFAATGWMVTAETTASAGVDLLGQVPLHGDFARKDPAMVAVTTYEFTAATAPVKASAHRPR
jgi:hypothetical protein